MPASPVSLDAPGSPGSPTAPVAPVVARMAHQELHAHALFRHAARVHGDATVTTVRPQGGSTTLGYAALAEQAWACAAQLQALGLRRGDPVVNLGVSSADQLAWLVGALSLGVVSHLLNPQHPAKDVQQLARAARPRLVLHDAQTQALARQLGDVPLLAMDQAGDDGLLRPAMADTAANLRANVAADLTANLAIEVPEHAPAFVCYSSGTTGQPKAVESTHRSTVLHAWACALPDAMGLAAHDRVMALMQAYHAMAWGAPFVCPLVGASLVLVPPHRDPARWYQWIEEHRVTVLGAVTAHWMALWPYMQAHGLRFSTLRRTVVGGGRLAPGLARAIAEGLGVEVCHAWGMTETSPLATMAHYDGHGDTLWHGKPVFGVELAVRGEGGACCAESESQGHPHGTGELLVRGHWVAQRGPQDSSWLPTGDLARLHVDGQLEVIDRLDEAVPVAGAYLSTALVEHAARSVPGVADAALLAPPTPGGGSTLAWVAAGTAGTAGAAMHAAVAARLAEHLRAAFDGWAPDAIVVVDALPMTPSGKVQKRLVQQRLAQMRQIPQALPARGAMEA